MDSKERAMANPLKKIWVGFDSNNFADFGFFLIRLRAVLSFSEKSVGQI